MRVAYFVAILWLCQGGDVLADEPGLLLTSWDSQDGLAQNSVVAIKQSADGYLWVGTRGGLSRFDGVRFHNFGMVDGLEGLDVVDILEDGKGGLWLGTFGGGLSHWTNGEIVTWTTEDGLAHRYATELALAGSDGLWVGGAGGLQHWSDKRGFTAIGAEQGLPTGEVTALAVRDDQLWVAIAYSGLYRCEDGSCEHIPGPPSAYALLADTAGDLWVSVGGGRVLRRHHDQWIEYNPSDGLPNSFIYCFAEGPDGEIWAGSQEEGLYVFRNDTFHAVTIASHGQGKPLRSIRSLCVSSEGIVWVGTQTGGLSRLVRPRVNAYPVGEEGDHGQVGGLVEGPPGQFWVTTYGGGLYVGELDHLSRFQHGVVNQRPFFLTGLRTSTNALYFAGMGSVIRADMESKEIHPISLDQLHTAICEGSDGSVWLGRRDGVLEWYRDQEIVAVRNGAFPSAISSLVRTGDQTLWVATRGSGLYRWEAGVVQQWLVKDGLPCDVLGALYVDADETLWIGTAGGGLAWLDHSGLSWVDERHHLGANVITQILEDDRNHLWLGSYQGIIRVPKQDLKAVASGEMERLHPLILDESEGLLGSECTGGYSPAGYRSDSGKLYFSTIEGVTEVDPEAFTSLAEPPSVLIETLTLNGKEALPYLRDSMLTLPAGSQGLTISYTAFNYRHPEEIRFQYQLAHNQGWNPWLDTESRSTSLWPLQPGEYVFRVKAANIDGRWSPQEAVVSFKVLPWFWQRLWFQALVMVALLVAGALGAHRWNRARLRSLQMREQLAITEAENQYRRNEVAHLTSLATLGELSASLAHELNQPLGAILSNAQAGQRLLLQDDRDLEEIREILQDIVADDQRANEVIRRLRKLLAKGEFEPEELVVNDVVQSALDLMAGELEGANIAIHMHGDPDLPPVLGDQVQLQQVLLNLILNARDAMVLSTRTSHALTVTTALDGPKSILVEVRDTGLGVAPSDMESIFQAYCSTKKDGLGLGLSLCRSIITKHDGKIWVANHEDGGAVFRITLPALQETT